MKESPDVIVALDDALDIFPGVSRSSPFSASRQAVSDNVIQDTKANLDEKLQNDYVSCMQELDEFHGKSKDVILAIDGTPEKATTKYKNNQYSHVNIGQKKVWETGFNHSATYNCTNQLFISMKHQNYHHAKHEKDKLKDYIIQLQNSCKTVEEAEAFVKFIDGDRGYYDAELFAAALFNLISIKCKKNKNVRVIIPKKFTRGKENKKIAYLEDPNSEVVFLDYINLSKYTHSSLIDMCKSSGMIEHGSVYQIPIATIAVVDGYKTNKSRTLKELQIEWMKNKNNTLNTKNRIDTLNNEYILLQKAAGIKKTSELRRIRGRKRTRFNNKLIEMKYNEIYKSVKYLKDLNKDRTKILNTLMFFCISTTPNENVLAKKDYFIKLAAIYNERWGIENGFKEDKYKFIKDHKIFSAKLRNNQ